MKITLSLNQITNRQLALKNELTALNKAAATIRKKEEHKRLTKIAKLIVNSDLDQLPIDELTKALRDLKTSVDEVAKVA